MDQKFFILCMVLFLVVVSSILVFRAVLDFLQYRNNKKNSKDRRNMENQLFGFLQGVISENLSPSGKEPVPAEGLDDFMLRNYTPPVDLPSAPGSEFSDEPETTPEEICRTCARCGRFEYEHDNGGLGHGFEPVQPKVKKG
jgi:hypothetical protein